MAALLQAGRLRERLVRGLAAPGEASAGRRFRIAGDAIAAGESVGRGDVAVVPSEQVLLLAVELPLPTARKRLEALPFAIEDRIADPLDAVHIALGAEIAPRVYLAAVVRHAAMREWIATVEASGAPAAALVPDALLLPMPPAGHWSIAVEGERALVRSADGTGFAIGRPQLPIAWGAGGRPPVVAWSTGVPLEIDPAPGDPTLDRADRVAPIDLRQGSYAYRRPAMSGLRQRVMTIAAAGVLAHGVIAAADTLVLRHQAHVRAVQTQALIATALPGVAAGDDAVLAAAAILPSSARAGAPDPLLPLLARVSAATGPVALTRLDYDRQGQRLLLSVEPGSEARLAGQLSAAGLSATAGPGNVIVRGSGA